MNDYPRGRHRPILPPLLLAMVVGVGALSCARRAPEERPNVVLIAIDTLRADHLGCYGYREIPTPHIDALAREGVLVRSENTHIPLTLPSFSTIMTSTLPVTTGVHYNEGFHLDASARTLAEVLRDSGYETGAVVAAVVLDSLTGISQGFARYDDTFPEFTAYQFVVRGLKSQFDHTQRRGDDVTDRALEMASMMAESGPFFLFAHYFDPHSPKDPPPPYALVDPLLPLGSTERQIQLYDGEIAFTDEQVGRLIRGLEERGLRENTLIVLTSDHGESLDAHGERSHGYFAYEPTLHVPLIYSMPGRVPAGRVYEGTAGHIDIAPTILEILGLAGETPSEFQGQSLFPFEEDGSGRVEYFESATPFVLFGWRGLRGVRDPAWKYIAGPHPELYHLSVDPGEAENLADRMPARTDSLAEALEAIVSTTPIFGEETGREMSVMDETTVDPAFKEKLQALGYIGPVGNIQSAYEEMFGPDLADPRERLPDYRGMLLSNLYMRRGMALMEQDSLEAASEELRRAIETSTLNEETHYYLGLCYGRQERYGEAIAELELAIAADPRKVRAHLALIDYRISRGDTVSVRGQLEDVCSWEAADPQELKMGAGLWRRLGEENRAPDLMARALELDPSFPPARLYLGERALARAENDSALALLGPLETLEGEDAAFMARAYFALAKCRYRTGDLEGAVASFRRSLDADSTSAPAWNQLGLVEDDLGAYDRALEAYDRALSLDPSMYAAWSNIGVSRFKQGEYAASREAFLRYLPHAEDEGDASKVRAFIAHIEELETGDGGR